MKVVIVAASMCRASECMRSEHTGIRIGGASVVYRYGTLTVCCRVRITIIKKKKEFVYVTNITRVGFFSSYKYHNTSYCATSL